ncbi:sugar transferase [Crocinitomicaceae bacterium]|nr:sugar transferase [Crocinitomicaceae bacterium]MDB3906179.1 sugar transferase [Crocinitomicaceae bacterium]
MKRIFDISISTLTLIVFFPFGLIISLLILFTSKGGIFYLQERIGQNATPFKLIKFRTMKVNAEASGQLTVGMRDPRITSIGYFLRKTKLDEFPQFINVLVGQMSIVGPRPEVKKYVEMYSEDQKRVLEVKPGITDYASIEYFRENEILGRADDPERAYIEKIMPAKIALNMKYIENPGVTQDIRIMWKTFLKIIKR